VLQKKPDVDADEQAGRVAADRDASPDEEDAPHRSAPQRTRKVPSVIAASARLKTGQMRRSTKSMTAPRDALSVRLLSEPPRTRPTQVCVATASKAPVRLRTRGRAAAIRIQSAANCPTLSLSPAGNRGLR